MQQNINKTIQLLRLPQVLERFPVCKSKWWAGVKLGDYPQPTLLGKSVFVGSMVVNQRVLRLKKAESAAV